MFDRQVTLSRLSMLARAGASLWITGSKPSTINTLRDSGDGLLAEMLNQKAGVSVISTDSGLADNALGQAVDNFIAITAIDRFIGIAQRAIFEQATPCAGSLTSAGWVAEADPIPFANVVTENKILPPRKIGVMIGATAEVRKNPQSQLDAIAETELRAAVPKAVETALFDYTNSGSSSTPASPFYNAPNVAGSGEMRHDLSRLIDIKPATLNLRTAFLCMDSTTATKVAIGTDGGGALNLDISSRGGSLCGLPVVISDHVPRDSSGSFIGLLDPAGMMIATGAIEIDASRYSALNLSDSPTSPSTLVSMFQTNSVAFKLVLWLNWLAARPCACYIESASW